jgi:hypothetical protein
MHMDNFDRESTDPGRRQFVDANTQAWPGDCPGSANKSTRTYVVLKLPGLPDEPERVELGIVASDQPGLVQWDPGSPPSPLPPVYTIVKRYLVDVAEPSSADWRGAQLEFAREFPPQPVSPRPTPAWLSLDGRFYACRWLEHDRLSYRLSAMYYGDPAGTKILERRGWLRVQRDGTIIRAPSSRTHISQRQLDVLFSLAQLAEGAYRDNIRDELELARVRARLNPPGPDDCA